MSQKNYMLGLSVGHFFNGVCRGMQEGVNATINPPGRRKLGLLARLRNAIYAGVQEFRRDSTASVPAASSAPPATVERPPQRDGRAPTNGDDHPSPKDG